MQKKILAIIVVAIIIVAAVAAVELTPQSKTPSTAPRNIVIGLVAPVSGSPVGVDMQRAAEMAMDEINNAGGVYVSSMNAHSKYYFSNR